MKLVTATITSIVLLFGLASPLAAKHSESSNSDTAFKTNYLLTLTLARADKAPAEIKDVFAAPRFRFSALPVTEFDGTVSRKGQTLVLKYSMAIQNKVRHGKDSVYNIQQNLRATARLALGRSLVIFKDPDKTITIKVVKLSQHQAEGQH